MSEDNPNNIISINGVSKFFGTVIALKDINFGVKKGEVHALLGDNGAGKSTLIKILSGVHNQDIGEYLVDDKPVKFGSPRDALDRGIATVYQDLALVPLMSIARNFFMGREPIKKFGPISLFDQKLAYQLSKEKMAEVGINIRDPGQAVGTLSGGERQCLAIARAMYFGARVLILDEPTAALGVKQSSIVLKLILKAKKRGISVIFITHNPAHAYAVADTFTVLNLGKSVGTFTKEEKSKSDIIELMSGGEELENLED